MRVIDGEEREWEYGNEEIWERSRWIKYESIRFSNRSEREGIWIERGMI